MTDTNVTAQQAEIDRKIRELESQRQQPMISEAAKPKDPTLITTDRIRKLRSALAASTPTRVLNLPVMSRAYGARIDVNIGEVTIEELVAADLLPGTSRKIVMSFIRRSEELTAEERNRVNLIDMAAAITREEYAGDALIVGTGMVQMIRAFCVLGVRSILFDGELNDPPIRLTVDSADPDLHALYVGNLPESDVNLIAQTVMENMEREAAQAEPFHEPGDAARAMDQIKTIRDSTVNPHSV